MRAFVHVALTLLALFIVAAALHSLAPYPMDDQIGVKLQFFADHKDDYDLLIIGSSRTLAGVIPKRVEAEMATRGIEIRAFNLAMNGMGSNEADATIREVLTLRPSRLRWVVAELDYRAGVLRHKNKFSHRTFLWHDAETTLSAMRSAYLFARKPAQKRQRVRDHFLHFAGYATALGRGPAVVTELLTHRRGHPSPDWLIKDQGYQEPGWGRGEDRISFFSWPCGAKQENDQLAFYRRKVKRVSKRNRDVVELDDLDLQAIARRSVTLRDAGIVPIHFIPPRLKPSPHLFLLKERGHLEHLFAFNEPEAYPQLYALENRWDCDHLAQPGAEILSDLLAARIAEMASDPAR